MVTFHTHLTVRPIPLFISFYDRAPFPNPRAPNSESKVSINSMAVLSLRRRVLQHRAHERITAFKPFQIKVFFRIYKAFSVFLCSYCMNCSQVPQIKNSFGVLCDSCDISISTRSNLRPRCCLK